MAVEIRIPSVGESISEVTLVKWHKKDGEYALRDEVIAELESEKASFEINAEQAGTVTHIAKEGDTLAIGDLVCSIDTDAVAPVGAPTTEVEPIVDKNPKPSSNAAPTTETPKNEVKAPQSAGQ